jgi:hypothetical protein
MQSGCDASTIDPRMNSDYGLTPPSEERTVESFERILGEVEGRRIWLDARTAAGLEQHDGPLSPEQLGLVAKHLAARAGLVGILGTSLQTRLDTYSILTRIDGASTNGQETNGEER